MDPANVISIEEFFITVIIRVLDAEENYNLLLVGDTEK
jgi:hypothetical protein